MSVATINLYINVITKQLVSVNGSPTTVPDIFYGDFLTLNVFPVVPASSNPAQGYVASSFVGYTMNCTCADAPNATSPPTPFAETNAIAWNTGTNAFTFNLNMTSASVGAFIGANPAKIGYINFDVFDVSTNRSTLYQGTFNCNASIDTFTVIPGPPGQTQLTLQQALQFFLLKTLAAGDGPIFTTPDGTKTVQLTVDNNLSPIWTRLT